MYVERVKTRRPDPVFNSQKLQQCRHEQVQRPRLTPSEVTLVYALAICQFITFPFHQVHDAHERGAHA